MDLPSAPGLTQAAFLAGVNHLLVAHSWATEKLRRHAGRRVILRIPPFEARFVIESSGLLAGAFGEEPFDATLILPPGALAKHFASGSADTGDLETEGDSGLAVDVANVLRGLRWDAEEDLSLVFGDIAAHRLVSFGKAFLSWKTRAALSLGQSLAEYWTEEKPLLAKTTDIQRFTAEVDEVRDAVERLEKRIERLKGQA